MSGGWFPAPEDIVRDPDLGPGAAILYGRIWRYCQGGGTCYASAARLADECGVGVRTVSRWISALRAARYITVKSGAASGASNVISTTRRWVMGLEGSATAAEGVGQIGRGGRPKRPTRVGQNGRRLKEAEDMNEEKRIDASPLRGSSSSRPAKPALPDHDGDDKAAGSAVDYPEASEALEAIITVLAANPCKNPEGRALTAWSAIRRAAPTATAEDIQAAAADWADRWERIKGHAPDPLQASQLPDVVAAYIKSQTTASRAGHGLVPVIER